MLTILSGGTMLADESAAELEATALAAV